jgi:prepilin-type N-terminal cleavage/methylation domain-containing protein
MIHHHHSHRKPHGQYGFTLIELMVSVVVLLAGVIAVAELVPVAISLNTQNRADSSSLVYAQRELDQFVDQPFSVTSFTDQQGNVCSLGSSSSFNTVVGNPVRLSGLWLRLLLQRPRGHFRHNVRRSLGRYR